MEGITVAASITHNCRAYGGGVSWWVCLYPVDKDGLVVGAAWSEPRRTSLENVCTLC